MDIYGALFRAVLFPGWERSVKGRATPSLLSSLERSQWSSLDELRRRQAASLARLLRHAHDHIPFYRQRFEQAGVRPEDILGPDDLARLPILAREEARADPKRLESPVHPRPTLRKHTSGTTGEPLLFGYEPESEWWRQAMKLRAYAWAGYDLGAKALHFWGAPPAAPPPAKTRAKTALDRWMKRETYVPCARMGEEDLDRAVRLIEAIGPRVLVCYAQAGGELARFVNLQGRRSWGAVRVICGAEPLYPHDREALEQAFGEVFDTYGCREVMLIGAECEAHDGLHTSMENLVVEIVVTEPDGSQRPAREGERGAVVLTDLHNLGMPFIRYANGDEATQGPLERCRCGRWLRRLHSVQGRSSETLRNGRGEAVSGVAVSFLFRGLEERVKQFQAVQRADRSVTLKVVPRAQRSVGRAELEQLREAGSRLLDGCPIHVELVDELPRTKAGKHRLVIVEKETAGATR